jgi:hypothetical protein
VNQQFSLISQYYVLADVFKDDIFFFTSEVLAKLDASSFVVVNISSKNDYFKLVNAS